MWRYFGRSSGNAAFYELYRWPANGKPLAAQRLEDVQMRFADGSWRPNYRERLYRDVVSGWFDEESDELTQEQAETLVEKWHRKGWPGTG